MIFPFDLMLLRNLRWTFIPSPYKHNFYHITLFIKMQLSLLSGNFFSLETKYFTIHIFFPIVFFSDIPKENTLLLYLKYPGRFGGTLFFRIDDVFCLVSFSLFLSNIVYHFLYFRKSAFASVHNFYLSEFVLSMFYNFTFLLYSICLRYLRRAIFLRLNDMFFRIPFVSDTWEELYYFALIICFSVFRFNNMLFRIPFVSDTLFFHLFIHSIVCS